ncbi:MAG TPA: hypothetical protein VF584_02655 [Longimicrobium sp.]
MNAASAGGSLAVWVILLSAQIATWPIFFLLGVYLHLRPIGLLIEPLLGIGWFAIPFGSCYGARLGVLYVRRHPGNPLAWTGIVLNCLYLLFGIFMLLLLAADIHV